VQKGKPWEARLILTAKAVSTFCLILGAIGLVAEIANFFPTKDVGLIGAILFAAGVLAIAITERSKSS
jgi:hypothetical protein